MPYINDSRFLTLPQQVKKNKDDILTHQETADVVYAELEAKDAEQDIRIDNNDSDIEQLQDAVASGGVIVTRKIGLSADLAVPALETKIDWDVETEPSNEPTAVNKDANNDHTLITDGKYKVEVPVSIENGPGAIRITTLNIYIQDTVTFAETLIKTQDVSVGSSETVNTSVQVDYTKSNNTKAVLVKVLGDPLTILKNTESHITSYFTVAGAGTVTQTKNIAPTSVVDEGVKQDEATLSEILSNYKSLMIQYDGSANTILKRNGIEYIKLDNGQLIARVPLSMDSKQINSVADPTAAQDAATKNYVDTNFASEAEGTISWTSTAFSTAQSGSAIKLGTKVVSVSIQAIHPGTWAPSDLVGTLPSGFRPNSIIEVSASKSSSGSAVTCQISTTGAITLAGFTGTLGGQIDINTTFNIV